MDEAVELRRTRRKAKGLTLSDVAGRIGLSTGQLSRIETQGTTSLPVAMALSEMLELPVESFAKP